MRWIAARATSAKNNKSRMHSVATTRRERFSQPGLQNPTGEQGDRYNDCVGHVTLISPLSFILCIMSYIVEPPIKDPPRKG